MSSLADPSSDTNGKNPEEMFSSKSDRKKSRSESKDDGEGDIRTICDIIGDWGQYQSRLFGLYIAIYVIAPIQNQGVIFYTDQVDYWCKLPDGINKASVI